MAEATLVSHRAPGGWQDRRRRRDLGRERPPDLFLARFLPDGSLDSSFGTGGVVRTLVGTQDEALAIAIQPDGDIVVAGVAVVSGQSRMLVARYLP